MIRREFLQMAVAAAQVPVRPNVVLILADDLGWKDLGFMGAATKTPNLDRLAAEGVRFGQMYACPLCSPTRAALLTGRHPIRFGLGYTVVRPWSTYGLPVAERTMGNVFADAGYETAIVGKWHLGHYNVKQLPRSRGFGHFYGHLNGAIDYYTHMRDGGLDWQRNGVGLREKGYTTELLAAEAERWLRTRNRTKPFFLYLPFNAPHAPLQAPEAYLGRYASIADEKRRAYCAMVDCLDAAVGRVLDAVRGAGPTIVVFVSDNGGPRGSGADNGELRAGKATVFEGGIRVPAILHGPEWLKPGSYGPMASVMDLLPTLAEAVGIPLGEGKALDGVSHWGALRTGSLAGPRSSLFSSVQDAKGPRQHAFREGPWKLVRIESAPAWELLFQVEDDPSETSDRLQEEPEVAERLRKRLKGWVALQPPGEANFAGGAHPGYVVPKDYAKVAVE